MILVRSGLIRICKGAACLGLIACTLGCFLLSYSYVSGDREDREDMRRTLAKISRKASFVQSAQAELSSQSSETADLQPPLINDLDMGSLREPASH